MLRLGDPARPERAGMSDRRALQRRRVQGGGAARTGRRGAQWLDAGRGSRARQRHVLEAADLDLAVARGAAYYGLVRRGQGVRIRGGTARAYYVGIESRAAGGARACRPPLKALCVVPFGMEEGTEATIPAGSSAWSSASRPSSASRLDRPQSDHVGTLVEDWGDDMEELSPLDVTAARRRAARDGRAGDARKPCHRVGTLELWCVSRDQTQRWKLELNIREREP